MQKLGRTEKDLGSRRKARVRKTEGKRQTHKEKRPSVPGSLKGGIVINIQDPSKDVSRSLC